jgi:hypothetical protein
MDLFLGVTGSAVTKSGCVKVMGWLEEITLALKRVFDFEVSDSSYR